MTEESTSELRESLQCEGLLHGLEFFSRQGGVDGDLKRSIPLLDQQTRISTHGGIEGIIPDAAGRCWDIRLRSQLAKNPDIAH